MSTLTLNSTLRSPLTVAVLAVALLLGMTSAFPPPASADPGDHVKLPAQCLTGADDTPDAPIICRLGPFNKKRPTLVLWGDSHMWMMIPAVRKAASGQGVNVVTFIQGACPPGNPKLTTKKKRRRANVCEKTNHRAMQYVARLQRNDKPVRVLLGGFWGLYIKTLAEVSQGKQPSELKNTTSADLFRTATPPLFSWLGRKRIPTDVIVQGAVVPRDEETCEAGTFPWRCSVATSRAIFEQTAANRFLKRSIAKLSHSPLRIDVNGEFCNRQVCRARSRGVNTWWDRLHISARNSKSLWRYFRPTISRLKASAR